MAEFFKKPKGLAVIVVLLTIVVVVILGAIHGIKVKPKDATPQSSGVPVAVSSQQGVSAKQTSSSVTATVVEPSSQAESSSQPAQSSAPEATSKPESSSSNSSTVSSEGLSPATPATDNGSSALVQNLTETPDFGREFSAKAKVSGKGLTVVKDQYLYRLDLALITNSGKEMVLPYYTQSFVFSSVSVGEELNVVITVNDNGFFSFVSVAK